LPGRRGEVASIRQISRSNLVDLSAQLTSEHAIAEGFQLPPKVAEFGFNASARLIRECPATGARTFLRSGMKCVHVLLSLARLDRLGDLVSVLADVSYGACDDAIDGGP
jgi:hypothetical protein